MDLDDPQYTAGYYRDVLQCFAPSCKKYRRDCPNSVYLGIPKALQATWCQALHMNCPKRSLYVCEEHINIEEDCYKTKSGKLRLKNTANLILSKTYDDRADVWALKNVQMLSFMKCAKCGTTNKTNPELSFYKFPCPDLEGNSSSAVRCRAWAEFCWPDKVLTPEELMDVYKEKKLLCSRHFLDKNTAKQYGLQVGVPTDLATEGQKNPIVRTYGKKVGENTDSNKDSKDLAKHNFLNAEKKVKKSRTTLSTEENKFHNHNFLEGENPAELFETIDEVFEGGADVSMYEEIAVKQEPCETLLHEGYKCDLCLSSISGYRYTCVQCADVDLCAACEASGAHAAHYVLRIPRPRPEDEVEELLKELRDILKKRPPTDRPVEKIIVPSKRVSTSEDPLQAPAPPEKSSTDQSESDDESTESESENENDLKRPHITVTLPPHTSRIDIDANDIKDSQTSREEIEPPKHRQLDVYEEPKATSSKILYRHLIKTIKRTSKNPVNVSQENAKNASLVSTLKEKLNSVLDAALSSETVQQAKAEIEAELNINKYDDKLEIGPEKLLGKSNYVELGGSGPSDELRSRRSAGHLKEAIYEVPLDFIMERGCFNENDPLSTGVAKASKNTENVQIVTVQDARSYSKRRKI